MTTSEPGEQGKTAPIELPTEPFPHPPHLAAAANAAPRPAPPAPDPGFEHAEPGLEDDLAVGGRALDSELPAVARAATPMQQEVMYIPLAVSVGDGFKFGCGFFLASVLAMLIGFVLLAALFVLTNLLGLNLPLAR